MRSIHDNYFHVSNIDKFLKSPTFCKLNSFWTNQPYDAIQTIYNDNADSLISRGDLDISPIKYINSDIDKIQKQICKDYLKNIICKYAIYYGSQYTIGKSLLTKDYNEIINQYNYSEDIFNAIFLSYKHSELNQFYLVDDPSELQPIIQQLQIYTHKRNFNIRQVVLQTSLFSPPFNF